MKMLGSVEFRQVCKRTTLVGCLFAFIWLLLAQASFGALLGQDSFNYAAGDVLSGFAGGTGWDGPWFSEENVTIENNELVFGGQSGAPTAALIGGADFLHLMSRPFAGTDDDTVYFGMLLRTDVWDDDFMQLQVSDGETGNNAASMTVGLDGRNPIGFYARTGTSGQGSSFSEDAEFETETDYFLVGKFSKIDSDTYNQVELFVNPGDTEPDVADALRVDIDSTLDQLSLFTVRTALMEGDEEIYIDELRVGTTFNDILLLGVELPDPGDFNADGSVTLVDFEIMKMNFKEPGGFSEGDLNFDGVVDMEDFRDFIPIFTAANPGQALSIPEPSSFLGLSTLLLMSLACRNRRRRPLA